MKKTSIIIGAVIVYIIIMAAGIGAYFYFDQQQKLHQEQMQAQLQQQENDHLQHSPWHQGRYRLQGQRQLGLCELQG